MQRTLRQPPPYGRHPGACSLCAGPLPPRCRTWCHDCPLLWAIATSALSAHGHLVATHGYGCWGCGATWQPGVTEEHQVLGYVYGGHPIHTLPKPKGTPGNPWDRIPAPEGWTHGAWCDWPGPHHGPPEPVRVPLEVEHIRPLWSLTEAERDELRWWLPFNLQLLCRPCHAAKTRREAAERAALRRGDPLPPPPMDEPALF